MKRLTLALCISAFVCSSSMAQSQVAAPEGGTPPTVKQESGPQPPKTELKEPELKQEAKPQDPAKPSVKEEPKADPKPPAAQEPKFVEGVPLSKPVQEPVKPVRKRLPHIGSTNSPKIPGQPWRVHDAMRPRPPVVVPGEKNEQPPSDAIVLFDGSDLSNWCHRGDMEELYEAEWKIVDGCLEVAPRTGNLYTIDSFGSCQLHIEWMIPEGTQGASQGRGNSGIKLMEKFEIQVLDSYRNRTYADGQAGSIYGQFPPLVNAVRKQGEWQTYDIFFSAPQFENDKLVRPASITLLHNGVLVQLHRELTGPTGASLPKYSPMQPAAPIMLQDHGNKVRYRNIWVRSVND